MDARNTPTAYTYSVAAAIDESWTCRVRLGRVDGLGARTRESLREPSRRVPVVTAGQRCTTVDKQRAERVEMVMCREDSGHGFVERNVFTIVFDERIVVRVRTA